MAMLREHQSGSVIRFPVGLHWPFLQDDQMGFFLEWYEVRLTSCGILDDTKASVAGPSRHM